MILGLDVSNHQWPVNMAAARSAGREFVVIKASEGVGFTDPRLAAHRANAHAAGLVVGLYHFARDNTPASEAAYFAQVVGALQPGEFLVLDQEVTHAGGNVPWCAAWLAAVRARYGVAPLIYMNQGNGTGVTSGDWTQVAKTNGLWLARYDGAPNAQTSVNYWGPVAMKQYSDAGSVLGVPGTCDVNAFYGTADQLRAYGYQGSTPVMSATGPASWDAADWAAFSNQTGLAVWGFKTSGKGTQAQDRLTGIDEGWLPAISKAIAAIPSTSGGSPAVSAQQVADLVIAALGQRISTPPTA